MDWIEDTQRRRATGIPGGMTFAANLKIGEAIMAAEQALNVSNKTDLSVTCKLAQITQQF